MIINAKLVGDSALLLKLQGYPTKIRIGLREAIQRLAIQVQTRVKEKLSGEVLKNRTGKLRSSINQEVQVESDSIVAVVGTNVSYAARHEYGFHGTETVKAHIRRSRGQMAAATYTYTNKAGVSVSKTRSTGKYGRSTGDIQVRSFTRQANTPERSFLRSSLKELSSTIKGEMAAAVSRALK